MSPIDILKELRGKEITTYKEDGVEYASIYKWHSKFEEIKLHRGYINLLIFLSLLEEDSGNFETGEVHYVLSVDKLNNVISKGDGNTYHQLGLSIHLILPAIREIRLNRILN